MTLSFRTAEESDANALNALVNSAYRGESSKRGWTTEADLLGGQRTDPETLAEAIRTPDSRIELAESETRLIGCVHLKREASGYCYLGMLTVDPGRQTTGLGKQLLEHSERVARSWGCHGIRMTVIDVRTELIQFYERRGYRLTGVTLPFPADPKFGVPRVALRFVEMSKSL